MQTHKDPSCGYLAPEVIEERYEVLATDRLRPVALDRRLVDIATGDAAGVDIFVFVVVVVAAVVVILAGIIRRRRRRRRR